MKPIRFFKDQQTIWYNLFDFIQVLLDMQTIHAQRPNLLRKRRGSSKSIFQILLEKVNRLSPVYQRQRAGAVYVDWVVFEHLYRFFRPLLIRPDDWADEDGLFRQLQLAIEHPKRLPHGIFPESTATYFSELPTTPSMEDNRSDS